MLSPGNINRKYISSFALLSRFGSGNSIYYRCLDIEKWTNGTAFVDGRNVVVQSLRHVQLFVTPWIAAQQSSLSLTVSWRLLKLMSIESVMPSDHLILCCCVLLLPSIFPSIRVFSSDMQRICPCPNNQNLWKLPYLEKNPGRFHSVNVSNWDHPGLSKRALNPMTHALINNRKANGDVRYR